MFLYVPHPTVDDDTQRTQLVGSCGHESSPTCRMQSLRLLDIHHMPLFIGICEVHWRRWSWAFALDHLYGDGRAVYSGAWLRRKHFQTIQEASVGILEFDQSIPNLESQITQSWNITLFGTYVAC